MEIAATYNPVTYIMEAMRSLVLQDFEWSAIGRGTPWSPSLGIVMVALSIPSIRRYN